MVPRYSLLAIKAGAFFVGGNMNKKEVNKAKKITMEKFLREYCGFDNEIVIEALTMLSHKELKEVLNFGKNKVYKLLQNGEIPSTKIGRDYRILKINVINYLQNQK